MNLIKNIMIMAFTALIISSCSTKPAENNEQISGSNFKNNTIMMKIKQTEFYKDGVLDKGLAKEAYFDLMKYYGVPVTPILKTEEFWVSDFAQKDFASIGMGGIFWVNDVEQGYFGHDIYLLPGQMLVEHKHNPTEAGKAKMETWQVRHGSAYFFGEGESTEPMPVQIPQSQIDKGGANSKHCKLLEEGGILPLNRVGAWHFIIAGPKGAIITEYATPHDNAGLEFANKSVVF